MYRFREYHPIVNLIFLVLVISLTMSAINPLTAGISLICALVYGGWIYGFKFYKYLLFLAIPVFIFAGIIVPMFNHRGVTPLFYVNDMAVTLETISFGLVTGMVMLSVIAWFYIAGSMIDTEKFLYLSGRVLPTIALIISMALRMIPLFLKRYREVSEAQIGLGRNSKDMPFIERIRFAMKKISIVVSWSLENSVDTTVSMESRGFGCAARTHAHLFRWMFKDMIMSGIIFALGVAPFVCGIMGRFRVDYFPGIRMMKIDMPGVILLVMIFLLMSVPLAVDVASVIRENNNVVAKERKTQNENSACAKRKQ